MKINYLKAILLLIFIISCNGGDEVTRLSYRLQTIEAKTFELNEDGEQIIKRLEQIGTSDAIRALNAFIKLDSVEENWNLRRKAGLALFRLDKERLYDTCIEILQEDNNSFKPTSATFLSEIGNKEAIPYLLEAYSKPDAQTHKAAFFSLLQLGHSFNKMEIQMELENSDLDIQGMIIMLVGEYGNPNYLPLIEPFKDHDNKRIRELAVEAIAKLNEL